MEARFAYVEDAAEICRLASAAGTIADRLPTPFSPFGRVGYVQWVCTETEFRRRATQLVPPKSTSLVATVPAVRPGADWYFQ